MNTGYQRAAQVARHSYGRVLALLAARTGDIAAAEDALADAFRRALEVWPETGVPDRPEAWLMTVARNRLKDGWRAHARRPQAPLPDTMPALLHDLDPDALPDRRLDLLFVCAHPAIDAGVRTPLMLQTVLGLDAAQVARAFHIPRATMAQRLVRAKRKIRDARIPFTLPTRHDLAPRLSDTLEAIYAAYSVSFQGEDTPDPLPIEALFLADLIATLMPQEPEALGLAALLNLSTSRHAARLDDTGAMIPLDAQDTARWNPSRINRGLALLHRARDLGGLGRFQIEAAIQSVHADRARSGHTDWGALVMLYAGLIQVAPTLGARVAYAAALGARDGPQAGIAALDQLPQREINAFQPYWATRAHLLNSAGFAQESVFAYARAITLTTETAPLRYLHTHMQSCNRFGPP